MIRKGDQLVCVAHSLVDAASASPAAPAIPELAEPAPLVELASPPFLPCEDRQRWQATISDALAQIDGGVLHKVVLSRRSCHDRSNVENSR